MPNLAKKDIERLLKTQTKQFSKKIDPLTKKLGKTAVKLDNAATTLDHATATLDRTTALVANLAVDFKEFRNEMKNVPSVLGSHTATLDAIFKNTEHWKTEAAALRSAIKRHEDWIAQIADKVGVKLEGLEGFQEIQRATK